MNNNKNNDKNPIELQISESFYLELFEKLKTLLRIDRETATYEVSFFYHNLNIRIKISDNLSI
jgi:hypothetical protein